MPKKEKKIKSFVGSLVNIPDTPFVLGNKLTICDFEPDNMNFRIQLYAPLKEIRIRMNPVIAILAGIEPMDFIKLNLLNMSSRQNIVCELERVDKSEKDHKYSPYVAIKSGYFCLDVFNVYESFNKIIPINEHNKWISIKTLVISYETIRFYL